MDPNNCKNELVIDVVQGTLETTSDAIANGGPQFLDMQNMEISPADELTPPPDCVPE